MLLHFVKGSLHLQIPNTAKPTLGTFLHHFPSHETGPLHFRFRMEDSAHEYVWLDVTSRDEVLPFYKESIMAKVLRTAEAPSLKRKAVLRRKNMEHMAATIVNGGAASFSKSTEPAAGASSRLPEKRPQSQPTSTANTSGGSKNQYERNVYPSEADATPVPPAKTSGKAAPPTKPKPAPASKPAAKPAATPAAPPSAPSPTAASPDILDFDESTADSSSSKHSTAAQGKATPVSAAPVSDMMDFEEGPAPQQSQHAQQSGSQKHSNSDLDSMIDLDGAPQMSRAELKATREDKINEQVQKVLDEKLEVKSMSEQPNRLHTYHL